MKGFKGKSITVKNSFFYENMFQGPKGYRAQICEVQQQYENMSTKWPFYTFFKLILLYTNMFSLVFSCS